VFRAADVTSPGAGTSVLALSGFNGRIGASGCRGGRWPVGARGRRHFTTRLQAMAVHIHPSGTSAVVGPWSVALVTATSLEFLLVALRFEQPRATNEQGTLFWSGPHCSRSRDRETSEETPGPPTRLIDPAGAARAR
jgi:hypothetical protein